MYSRHEEDLSPLIEKIEKVIDHVVEAEQKYKENLEQVHPHYRESARNLVHYMALRSFDLREVQEELSMLSISSLGHSEGYTMTNLRKILELLRLLSGEPVEKELKKQLYSPFNYYRSRAQLRGNARELFGQCTRGDLAQIMVTMDRQAAYDYQLIRDLVRAGMDIARINTSHEGPEEWEKMIANIERAEEETGRSCLVYMDLAGPKLRTARLDPVFLQEHKKGPFLLVRTGDRIRIVGALPDPAKPRDVTMPQVVISLPEIFEDVRAGESIVFDDGKIRGKIVEIVPEGFIVEITYAKLDGARLRADKGINLPNTALQLPSLTGEDYAHLPFIASHADMIGYSFVRQPSDVEQLQADLKKLGHSDIGLILKIETKEAFENLPLLLLTAMKSAKVGVMIARGDLAVEMGFERISEVQEEILWICEAAHIPGVWATQVLEKLAKKGIATRAEITDAAMSARAECVMLNKGPYVVKAVSTLDDIIRRMATHQFKRKSNLRPLAVARNFLKAEVISF
jgi:pyruvate kinase